MNGWLRFRKWAASLIWPEHGKEVEQLTARLATVHGRMQDLYWEGKAKEIAYSRIAGLEDALWRSCVAIFLMGEPEAARQLCEENGIHWDPEKAEKWRKPKNPVPAAALSGGQEHASSDAVTVKICDCGYKGGEHTPRCYSNRYAPREAPPPPAECKKPIPPEPGKGMPI